MKLPTYGEVTYLFEEMLSKGQYRFDPLSEGYRDAKSVGETIFALVMPVLETFLSVVEGRRRGSDIGFPKVETALCFPKRFLKAASTEFLPTESRSALSYCLGMTLLLGLMSHVTIAKSPTRANVATVDVDSLFRQWVPESLIADMRLAEYDKQLQGLPSDLSKSYYTSAVEPMLRRQFKLGFWTLPKCWSYFNDLFFAGAYLGLILDRMTQEASGGS